MTISIRPGRPADAGAVSELLGRSWALTYAGLIEPDEMRRLHGAWHAPDVLARQTTLAAGRFLVAETGADEIVGHGFSLEAEGVLDILRIYVDERFQRRGIGRRLVDASVGSHAGRIRLHVVIGNEPALAFYRRLGFALVGTATGEGGPPAWRMERDA